MENGRDDHRLTSLDIEGEGDDDDMTPSLMQSSSGDADGPLDINLNDMANKSTQQQSESGTNLPLLAACYLSALTTGATTYAFSFYSNALKTSLQLSQDQLDTLSSATFCAGVLSWVPGMVVDAWGARNAMALGGTGNFVNLSLYWLIATGRYALPSRGLLMFVLSALGVFIFMGCALVTGSVFKVIVEGCGPGTKGKAVGCAKGYVGVGSGVYVCLFGALFGGAGGGGMGGPAARALSGLNDIGTTLATVVGLETGVPRDPELVSLDFLLMAAALSFLAATLPALCLLPKNSATAYRGRTDGTRDVHFRVIYAGLMLLGLWVVGTSLMELKEEEQKKHVNGGSGTGGATELDPSTLNKTLLMLDDRSLAEDLEDGYEGVLSFSEGDSYARNLISAAARVLPSSPPERHWGSVFFILMLWWGPALSLLVIPPRKRESAEESSAYSSESDDEVAFDYDDGSADEDSRNLNRGRSGDDEEDEEETFLQDGDNPSRSRLTSFSMKKGEKEVPDEAIERNYTLTQMLRTCPAWLMAWTTVILVGGGTVMTNNIGQMTESLGFSSDLTPACLALFSAAQGASRVMTGIASELALGWKPPRWLCGCSAGVEGVPRPAFLALASLVSAASHLVLAASTSESGFALGATLSGAAFGMVWPMMVLITGEVFGTRHVGANYMFFDGFSSAAGTLLLSKFVAQEVYDEHIVEGHRDPGSPDAAAEGNFKCFGPGCFRTSHVVVSLLSLTCFASSVGLIRSTSDVYRRRRR